MKRRGSNVSRPDDVRDVLFEIGHEELPATVLADFTENPVFSADVNKKETMFELKARKVFEDNRVSFKESTVFVTPRRTVVWVKGVAGEQAAKSVMTKLLAKQEAYSESGEPAEKLLAILKHRGAALKDTVISDLNGKPYVFLKKEEPVQKTAAVLPAVFAGFVKSLAFPKNMRWGYKWEDGSDLVFPRPIRSFLCLYGSKALSFKIAGIPVQGKTTLFSKGGRKTYPVKSPAAYFTLLKKLGVILDSAERKKEIAAKLEKLAASLKGVLYEDPFLLNEVNFLVESPSELSAPFGEEFLKLPLEVLTVSMARKQRIFGMLDREGKVIPRFLAVLDGAVTAAEKKAISHNIENILHAKLQDSLFFYREDAKVRLEKKREELKGLVFLKGAGSMLEKSDRLVRVAHWLGERAGLSGNEVKGFERACFLSKADLLTQMVGEFPELQGVMGKYYALENGESADVAEAIGEQYLPRTATDRLPATRLGSLLSLLDKADLITAAFGTGIEPSSSGDPYGLRRSASAVVKIAVDQKIRIPVHELMAQIRKELGSFVQKDREAALAGRLEALVKDRFKAVMADRGFREDLIDAVMASGFGDLYGMSVRLEALAGIAGESPFLQAWKVVERTSNILKGNKETLPHGINPSLFAESVEQDVFRSYEEYREPIRKAIDAGDYHSATSLYAKAFFDILERFFEKVFVNAEDLNVRRNRLVLLSSIKGLYTEKIADLSKIKMG